MCHIHRSACSIPAPVPAANQQAQAGQPSEREVAQAAAGGQAEGALGPAAGPAAAAQDPAQRPGAQDRAAQQSERDSRVVVQVRDHDLADEEEELTGEAIGGGKEQAAHD